VLQDIHGGPGLGGSVSARRSRRLYRFGAFELRSETGQLSKHGVRIKVQTKPVQVLEALLDRPGELVTREELCKKLWPDGTFVDFENGLNTATNRLRTALGDSAEAPRYIETLPRLGYRFICPVVQSDENEYPAISPDVGLEEDTKRLNPPGAELRSLQPQSPAKVRSPRPGNYELARFSGIAAVSLFLVVVAALVVGYIHSKNSARRLHPAFRQLTFGAGVIGSARFAPDLRNVIYTAKWGGGRRQTYLLKVNTSRSQVLGFADGALTAVSSRGDLAFVSKNPELTNGPVRLSRVSVSGGAAQVIAEGTKSADWTHNGRELAIVREVGPDSVVEFPVGNVVYSSHGWIDCLRVAFRGDQVAFLEHPVRDDDAGHVRLVDRKGNTRVLTDDWSSVEGLAWSPSGKEVWFTASRNGGARVLYAVSETAKLRQISNTPSDVRLLDISSTGLVLIAVDDTRMTLRGAPGLGRAESDLSKLDFSHVDDISSDGNLVLFTEAGDAGGEHYETYIHNQGSRTTSHIASGRGLAISPDAKWVLTIDPRDRSRLALTSIDSRISRKVLGNGFAYQWAKFLPDGKTLIVGGAFPGEPLGIYTQLLEGDKPVPLNGLPYMDFVAMSPNGLRIAGVTARDTGMVFDLANHSARQMSPSTNAFPIAWSTDGKDLYAVDHRDSVYRIVKTNLQTGKVQLWKRLAVSDQAGIIGVAGIAVAPATGAYAYSTSSNLSRLYLVDGWL
jgi:DNA-binding winged helix-turn-helix (wHTH) protein